MMNKSKDLRQRDICELLAISLSTLERLRKSGTFPPATYTTPSGSLRWAFAAVERYRRARRAAFRANPTTEFRKRRPAAEAEAEG
jgi:predicted DNA-binding transcriptional regulator AlpA